MKTKSSDFINEVLRSKIIGKEQMKAVKGGTDPIITDPELDRRPKKPLLRPE